MPKWHCTQRGRRAWDQKALSVRASSMLLEGEDFFVRAACSLLLVLPRLLALPASGCGIWLAKRLHQGRPSRIVLSRANTGNSLSNCVSCTRDWNRARDESRVVEACFAVERVWGLCYRMVQSSPRSQASRRARERESVNVTEVSDREASRDSRWREQWGRKEATRAANEYADVVENMLDHLGIYRAALRKANITRETIRGRSDSRRQRRADRLSCSICCSWFAARFVASPWTRLGRVDSEFFVTSPDPGREPSFDRLGHSKVTRTSAIAFVHPAAGLSGHTVSSLPANRDMTIPRLRSVFIASMALLPTTAVEAWWIKAMPAWQRGRLSSYSAGQNLAP